MDQTLDLEFKRGNFTFQHFWEEPGPPGIHLSGWREDTPGLCDGYWDDIFFWEEDVRRLHSFLSQWLEKNSEDYF